MTPSKSLQPGANTAIGNIPAVLIGLSWEPRSQAGLEVDGSAFALKASGKVPSDAFLVFYNNSRSPDGSLQLLKGSPTAGDEDAQVFSVNFASVPAEIERITFCVTIHEAASRKQSFGTLKAATARLIDPASKAEIARFELPLVGSAETAMIFCEIYRRNAEWKFRAVGQGFVGGLAPLATSFGVNITADEAAGPSSAPAPVAAPPQSVHLVNLEKRLVSLEKKDPGLVSLAKKAAVSLEKKGLLDHQAKVALCLDISASMTSLYNSGAIDELVRRILALGLRFDDDGQIDVFLFGTGAHAYGSVGASNYSDFVKAVRRRYPLEGGTNYGKVMKMIRQHYKGGAENGRVPVYVMFVTDGDTQDTQESERQIRDAARESIFWQFMAIGKMKSSSSGFFARMLSSDFAFLSKLDTMSGRVVDNANFFQVENPRDPTDEQLYDLLMAEYPQWLKAAKSAGVLR